MNQAEREAEQEGRTLNYQQAVDQAVKTLFWVAKDDDLSQFGEEFRIQLACIRSVLDRARALNSDQNQALERVRVTQALERVRVICQAMAAVDECIPTPQPAAIALRELAGFVAAIKEEYRQ